MQQREIKGMEEIHWIVDYGKLFKRSIEELKKTIDNPNPFDLLYDAYEMHTLKRKRSQIEILKAVVFELKRDFNKEFTALEFKKEDYKL